MKTTQGQLPVTIGERSHGATCFWVSCPESHTAEISEKIKALYQTEERLKTLETFVSQIAQLTDEGIDLVASLNTVESLKILREQAKQALAE